MGNFWEQAIFSLQKWMDIKALTASHILDTFIIIALYVLGRLLIKILVNRYVDHTARRYMVGKTFNYLFGFIAAIAVAHIWIGSAKGLITYLSILSAGVAIALQDPLANLAGWLFIIIRRPFAVGDRIEIDGVAGDVIDLRLFQFSIIEIGGWVEADQSTGRIIHLPNGLIFKKELANYTAGFSFIWNELPVTVTFESDWQQAKEILQRIASERTYMSVQEAQRELKDVSHKYLIFYRHLTPIVWTKVVDIGITLTIRYLCQPRWRRGSETEMWEAILHAFAAREDIDFAYPTQRFYDNRTEGKPGKTAISDE